MMQGVKGFYAQYTGRMCALIVQYNFVLCYFVSPFFVSFLDLSKMTSLFFSISAYPHLINSVQMTSVLMLRRAERSQ